jgi:hypothetical protein
MQLSEHMALPTAIYFVHSRMVNYAATNVEPYLALQRALNLHNSAVLDDAEFASLITY